MALRCQVINLIRLHFLNNSDQIGRIGEIAVMHQKMHIGLVWVPVEMIHPAGVKRRCSPLDAMDFIAFGQQKFCQIGSVLPCDAGNQCALHVDIPLMLNMNPIPILQGPREDPALTAHGK